MILILSLGFSVFWAIWTTICLGRNYSRARQLGVPLVVLPIRSMNILWIIFQPAIISLITRCSGPNKLTRFGSRDWHFREKSRPHLELGDAWAIVTPGEIWFNIADPDAIIEVFQRRTEFIRPVELYQMLKLFGNNAATVSWSEWKRQRKIIAAPFNERTNRLVWTESLNQARDMIREWTQDEACENGGLQTDTRILALNVLAATGFKRTYKFHSVNRPQSNDGIHGYRRALSIIMDNVLFMLLVPRRLLCSSFVPRSWNQLGHAAQSFETYMRDLLDEESQLLALGKSGASQLTSSLLRASNEVQNYKPAKGSDLPQGSSAKTLTIEELLGNIFLINFAGHDTTANTLAYAIIHLAINPHVQDWIDEEVRRTMGESSSEDWDYESIFPLLKRPLAVIYETLRLFPPIMALPKYTGNRAHELRIGDVCITVPPQTYVVPSLLAVHTHPRHWGSDALEWRPSRWIDENDKFFVPRQGTYFPWSEGPQNCPGKKFAQVELVAVITALFHTLRVRPVYAPGENMEKARERLLHAVQQPSHGVLLRMKDADKIALSWAVV